MFKRTTSPLSIARAKEQNVAFLVGLAFAIAASANLPALLCTIYWKGTREKGIVAGIWTGLVSSTLLISISPTIMGAAAVFPWRTQAS